MKFTRDLLVMLFAALFFYLSKEIVKTFNQKKQAQFAGFFHHSFRPVAEAFRENIQSGFEKGAAFAVYHNGEILVDLWGGWADMEAERPWQENTISLTWSVVKGAAAVGLARLVDIGVLDYRQKVQYYWPEFTHDNVTIEMLLSHQTGLTELNKTISLFDVRDNWNEIESMLANATPAWPPGTAVGYHATTFGLYADALLRKVDEKHRNISTFFEEEIAKPLGIELSIGLPKNWAFRLARQHIHSIWTDWRHWPELLRVIFNPYFYKCSSTMDFIYKLHILNNNDLLSVGYPSTTGFGSARGIAKLYDFLANKGSIKGLRMLSPQAVHALAEPLTGDLPNMFFAEVPFSRGMKVYSTEGNGVFGHTGLGGSIAYADANTGLGVAYLTNHIDVLANDSPSFQSLKKALDLAFQNYHEKNVQ